MELSILAARILAVAYISVGAGVLMGRLDFNKMIEEFESSSALTYITGIMVFTLGMLLAGHHNLWVKDWRVLITLVGWAMIIKGILFMAFPQFLSAFKGWYKNLRIGGTVIIAIGLVFGYFGFVL